MRSEQEVMRQVLDFASVAENIRVVVMNGSRINKNAPIDDLRDYDIACFIPKEHDYYYKDQSWIKQFGELAILSLYEPKDGSFYFLMQFKDGVRIDLSFHVLNDLDRRLNKHSLSKVLLDKDHLIKNLPSPSEKSYLIKRPSELEFIKTLNDCWWIQTYVAKGIWREELPYAKYMFDVIVMECIKKLVNWYIGLNYDWKVNTGKCGKWFKRYLEDDIYQEFISLYPSIDYEKMWHQLFKAGEFIQKLGLVIANKLEFSYPMQTDVNVREYLEKVKSM